MYTDQWGHGPCLLQGNAFGQTEMEDTAAVHLAVMGRVDAYLGRMLLSDAQRLWLRSEILVQLGRTAPEKEEQDLLVQAFAGLQIALATLSGADELETRLALALGNAAHADPEAVPSRWLRECCQPVSQRSPMASQPMERSLAAAGTRVWQSLRGLWHKSRDEAAFQGGVR